MCSELICYVGYQTGQIICSYLIFLFSVIWILVSLNNKFPTRARCQEQVLLNNRGLKANHGIEKNLEIETIFDLCSLHNTSLFAHFDLTVQNKGVKFP